MTDCIDMPLTAEEPQAELTEPILVSDSVLDPDILTAAWLWARRKFVLHNGDDPLLAMSGPWPARHRGFVCEVTCFDQETDVTKVLLLKQVGDYYGVAALTEET
jgi:hypothetical protein